MTLVGGINEATGKLKDIRVTKDGYIPVEERAGAFSRGTVKTILDPTAVVYNTPIYSSIFPAQEYNALTFYVTVASLTGGKSVVMTVYSGPSADDINYAETTTYTFSANGTPAPIILSGHRPFIRVKFAVGDAVGNTATITLKVAARP